MNQTHGEHMTPAQRAALEAELAELEGPKRAEAVEAIKTARAFGDLSENFEYHAAKNEQGMLEARIAKLRARLSSAVVVEHDTDEHVVEALRAGASGFLVKDTRPAELLDAIRTVAAGEALLSPGPTARVIARLLRGPTAPTPLSGSGPDRLSDREKEVLTLVARGLNNTEIADTLGLSPLTAKTHVSRIMGKLGARDRAQLVVVAYESGLITPGA